MSWMSLSSSSRRGGLLCWSSTATTLQKVLVLAAALLTVVHSPLRVAATATTVWPVTFASSPEAATLLSQATAEYTVSVSAFNGSVTSFATTTAVQTAYFDDGGYDLAVGALALTASQQLKYTNIASYPLFGSALVVAYNLPSSAGLTTLIMPALVLCDIERGNVTNWNDSRIVAANPDLDIPDLGITVFHLSVSSSTNDAITSYCNKISPDFAAEISRSSDPSVFPTSKYYSFGTGASIDLLPSMVMDTTGGYTITALQNANPIGASVASIERVDGTVVTPSVTAIQLNLLELAVELSDDETSYDLTDPTAPYAWPICTLQYAYIDTADPVTTCATKTLVVDFLLNFLQDNSVALLATALNVAIVSDLYLTETSLLTTIKDAVECLGSVVVSSGSSTMYIEGFGGASDLVTAYTNFYSLVDSTYSYEYIDATETLSTERAVANEASLAVVNTRQLATSDVALMTEDSEGVYLPAFMTGVVITFRLPTTIVNAYASWSSDTSTLPELLPLTINLETVAKIFTGQVTNWTDDTLIETSPQLAEWFAAYPSVSTGFTTVVCCTSSTDSLSAGTLLLQGLNTTSTALSSNYSSYFDLPASFTTQVDDFGFTMLDTEARMELRATTLQAAGLSTIGYKIIDGSSTDTSKEFQIVQTVDGTSETITPEPANFEACATVGWATGQLADPSYVPGVISGCYPLATALSIGVNLVYTDDDCTQGNATMVLLQWLANTDALSSAALTSGLFRLADVDSILTDSNTILDTATCDGTTLLVTLPKVWSMNSAVYGFGIAIMAISLFVCAVSGILLAVYRHRTVLRTSSVPFLALTLLGLALMEGSLGAWSMTPSDGSCGSVMWLGCVGISLVFVPFFAKTYRIYMIFNRRQLKVVKMSNKKLMAIVGGLIALEIALLAAWTAVSPLKPISYTRNISGTYHQAALCSVDDTGMVFVVIETVYKGLILLAGTMLAISTRKVSSAFNESSAIAFSIYNVLFSGVLIGLIIYFVDAFEDTLILLFQFLLFWVTTATWGLMFAPKFYTLYSQTEEEAAQASRIDSLQTEKSQGGFSFVSVASMPANMIKGYVAALEAQLAKAKKQLTTVLGTTGQGLGVGFGLQKRAATGGRRGNSSLGEPNRSAMGPLSGGGSENQDTSGGSGGYEREDESAVLLPSAPVKVVDSTTAWTQRVDTPVSTAAATTTTTGPSPRTAQSAAALPPKRAPRALQISRDSSMVEMLSPATNMIEPVTQLSSPSASCADFTAAPTPSSADSATAAAAAAPTPIVSLAPTVSAPAAFTPPTVDVASSSYSKPLSTASRPSSRAIQAQQQIESRTKE